MNPETAPEPTSEIRADYLASRRKKELAPPEEQHWTDQPPRLLDQLALRWFGGLATRRMAAVPDLGIKLEKARIVTVPSAFLAGAYLQSFLVLLTGVMVFLTYLLLAGSSANLAIAVPLAAAPILLALMTYSLIMLQPDLRIRSRRRDIDENLPYALNFMAAMSGAGVVPVDVFGSLGSQTVYGEVAKEAAAVYRDTKIFSKDIVNAMKDAARRSPSPAFSEFLTGSINTVVSGGDLRSFFLTRAQFLGQEVRRKQENFLESLGVMAESYVVVGAAAPLFLIVIVSIMVLVNSNVNDPVAILNIIILLAMPVIHATFAYIVGTMKPE